MKSSTKVKVTTRSTGNGYIRTTTRINHNGRIRTSSKTKRLK